MRSHAEHALAVLVAVVVVTSGACSVVRPEGIALAKSDVPRASADPAGAGLAASAIDQFGFDLYRRLRADDANANLVISPASIAIALAMARAGARGETAAQMDAVLSAVGSDEHAAWINALDQALSARSGSYPDKSGTSFDLSLRIANAPFAQRDLKIDTAFLDALASRFGAGVRLVDYMQDPEGARRLVNGWVSDQTERRIPELVAPGVLDEFTRLVLVNAIYLKAPWADPFAPDLTRPGTFTRPDGSTVGVPMMAREMQLGYAEGNGWQAVELPYIGGSLAMTIVVPRNFAVFERSLDGDAFARLTAALAPREVDLAMPRFDFETKADLAGLLAALGMPLAFDPDRADFSGITTGRLFISHVVHQANITVDEKGTEAAAATAVVIAATAAPEGPVRLRVDRPFLFALRDKPTGAILFLGSVTDPSSGS